MKKYFLLITLFALLFLGLGNYTSADSVTDRNTRCGITTITTETINYVNQLDSLEGGKCCFTVGHSIVGLSACTTEQEKSCISPKNGKINSIGVCSCPRGTKNINDTCISCKTKGVCCGIELNTSVPFIGKCIEDSSANQGPDETNVTGATAFPVLMGSLTKILVTIILIVSFVLIIIGGIMIATGDPGGGKKMIMKVVVGIALLGVSGVILRLINPNFFG